MAYQLQAVLGTKQPLKEWCKQYQHANLVPLHRDLFLVPLIDELYDEMTQFHKSPEIEGFICLNMRIASLLKSLSHSTSIAYIEAEYFGGTGEQNAMLWRDGQMIYSEQGVQHAINHVLKELGITKDESKDEFDTVGLGEKRKTTDWIK